MKNRIIALLAVMVIVVMSFASCGLFPGKGGGGGKDDIDTGKFINGKYPWYTTNLIIQMNENSDSQQLPSSCRRYLAGDLTGNENDYSTVDEYVTQRNDAALEDSNVTITYTYLGEADAYGWGSNIDTIDEEVRSKDPERPDIYVNFVYDMVAVSLKGSFANLYSTTMPGEFSGYEHNYFEFTKDPAFKDTGINYMYEYMRSLTLSKMKMYCLSSDYFTDMVRAFFVVPVNIGLLETLESTEEQGKYNTNRVKTYNAGVEETNYTIEDFYQLVKDKQWTYETLADFSGAIFEEGAGGNEKQDLNDTLGFALNSSSGLSASGILYTTSITIINRTYDVATGEYTYNYPYMVQSTDKDGKVQFNPSAEGTHEELIALCNNLNTLLNKDGVISVNNNDATAIGAKDAIQAIRSKFAGGTILFGGVITLGSLEYDEYKGMNGQGKSGYGIVPVPLYRSGSDDEYLTQIHNNGKIGAISYSTEKFAQCSAFLNYQCMNSNDILNEYYDYKLQYDVVGTGVKGNVDMLKYIRTHVRSSFDKAFEDALGRFYNATDEQSMKQQWHTMIKDANFQLTDMADQYKSVTPVKAWRLYNLEHEIYPTLPN